MFSSTNERLEEPHIGPVSKILNINLLAKLELLKLKELVKGKDRELDLKTFANSL